MLFIYINNSLTEYYQVPMSVCIYVYFLCVQNYYCGLGNTNNKYIVYSVYCIRESKHSTKINEHRNAFNIIVNLKYSIQDKWTAMTKMNLYQACLQIAIKMKPAFQPTNLKINYAFIFDMICGIKQHYIQCPYLIQSKLY